MIELIKKLTAASGVSGNENEAAQVAKKLLEPYGRVEQDTLGNVICRVKQPAEKGEHILLDAHLDQIGFIVTAIDDKGFVKVAPCGGVDRRLVCAAEVTVHGKQDIYGVVCSTPPHLAKEDDAKKAPKFDDIAVDIGFSRQEAEKIVSLGDRITFNGEFGTLLNNQVASPSLDDRSSCAAILHCLELLKGKNLPCGLTVMFSTREEVGGQGAHTAAYTVNPTKSIAIDVSFGYSPDCPKHKCGKLGKGAMIGIAPTMSAELSNALIETAKQCNIPYQLEVMGGDTGTNADEIVTVRGGIKSAVVSVPLKYMHTPIETADITDIENVGRLLSEYILAKGGER